jgi:protein-tyrosine-phosphatase/DNA-binding transcriptional ArsR family regulator
MATSTAAVAVDPPEVVRLLAHPVRWRLLRELVRSDRTVRELTRLVDEPQSLVSYHLRLLHDAHLVVKHRSAADGRDAYYAVDLRRCRSDLHTSMTALHPGLWSPSSSSSPTSRPPTPTTSRRRPRVLFLCTGNSARSPMAEALAQHLSEGSIAAVSAGSHPKPLHPNAVKVMQRRGIDISAHRARHLDVLASQRFDVVVTLCDRVREVCPEFPSGPELAHWSIPDPSLEGSTLRASYPAFERTASEIQTRVEFLLDVLAHSSARRSSDHG